MNNFSLKKSAFAVVFFTAFGIGQALAQEEAKENKETQTLSETFTQIQPLINSILKGTYKIAKKSVLPIATLYLFFKYVSPLGKKFFGSKKEESSQSTSSLMPLDEFKALPTEEKLNTSYAATLEVQNTQINANKSDDKSPEILTSNKVLDQILALFIVDAYIKPPLKALQEKLDNWLDSTEEKLGLA